MDTDLPEIPKIFFLLDSPPIPHHSPIHDESHQENFLNRMKSENENQDLEVAETNDSDGFVSRNPTCYNISLGFSILTLLMVLGTYGDRGPGGMEGMFYGLKYLFTAAIALILSFVFAIIGFFRSEKATTIHKINGSLLTISAILLFLFLTF